MKTLLVIVTAIPISAYIVLAFVIDLSFKTMAFYTIGMCLFWALTIPFIAPKIK